MKRILFISAFEPSKRTGGQTFSLRLIETLKERYEIDLYYFTNEKLYNGLNYGTRISQSILVNKLRKFRNFLFFPFFHPFFGARFSWFWIFRFIKLDRKNKYDLIYFDFSQTHLYSLFFDPKRCLLMAHDVIWQKYQREGGIKRFQKKWIYISESIILKKKPNIFTFSEKDCLLIKEKYKHIALPTSFFIDPLIRNLEPLAEKKANPYFVLFGSWKRPENFSGLQWFLKEVYPEIKDLHLVIIGNGLENFNTEEFENIESTGFMENPFPLVHGSTALISPLFQGAGVKVKVFEALACGIPVIGSEISFEGIDQRLEKFFFPCSNASDYLESIRALALNNKVSREEIRSEFLRYYDQPAILEWIDNYCNKSE